jgi:hypothetical protein
MIKLYTFDDSTRTLTPVSVKAVPGGNAHRQKLYVKNDDPAKYYAGIKLTISGQAGLDFIQKSSIDCRLLSGDVEPTSAEWETASTSGDLLESPLVDGANVNRRRLPDLGNASVADEKYYPFWLRVKTLNPLRPGDYLYNIGVEYTEGNVS